MFYIIMNFVGVDIIYNHTEYRLTSKRVLENFENYNEVNLFLRRILFKNSIVYYEREERFAGVLKYPLKK